MLKLRHFSVPAEVVERPGPSWENAEEWRSCPDVKAR